MAKEKYPITPAIRVLRQFNIEFEPFEYDYEEKGGTSQTARELGVDEHSVIKTLIFKADSSLICVLMHGDKEASTKELSRLINVKKIDPADEKTSMNTTGYQFGGTSPFGHRREIPVYIEESIMALESIYINGGKRGFIIKMNPTDINKILKPILVNIAI